MLTTQTQKQIEIHLEQKYLILARGGPGSGKSFLAQSIKNDCYSRGIGCEICSTDDFFMKDGVYVFDGAKLGENHQKNRFKCEYYLDDRENCPVVIVDNTNITGKECHPYVELGLKFDRPTYLLIPDTEWAFKLDELVKRNTHGVSPEIIEKMLKKWESNEKVGQDLSFKLRCFFNKNTNCFTKE